MFTRVERTTPVEAAAPTGLARGPEAPVPIVAPASERDPAPTIPAGVASGAGFQMQHPRRAWSRAGAVAEVLLAGRQRRALALTARAALLVAGAVTIAISVGVLLWNELGPGPLDVFIVAVQQLSGVPLAVAVWATFALMIAVAWALGRRPGVGTLLAPLITGPVMQLTVAGLERFEPSGRVVVQLGVHLLAIAGIGLGAGALIVSGLGAGTGELLAAAASDRSGRTQPRTRMVIEATWLVIGGLLGGPIGLGTVVVALAIGPAVAHGYRTVDHTVATLTLHLVPGPR